MAGREQWKPIDDFEGFEVSNRGRVRNLITGNLMTVSPDGHGGLRVSVRKNGSIHTRSLGRLVAMAFLGPPQDESDVVAFKDNRPMNVNADNLFWVPRWHAQEWAFQARQTEPTVDRRVLMVSTGIEYENPLVCARAIHGIEKYIILSAQGAEDSQYMDSKFRWVL